jgi:hypothetical protein
VRGLLRNNFDDSLRKSESKARAKADLRLPAKKEAVSGSFSEQDDKRFRFRLDSPRAAAHVWGRVARILTEINRLPQPPLPHQGFSDGGFDSGRLL